MLLHITKAQLILICAIIALIVSTINTLGTQTPVKCQSSQMCDPSAKPACSLYQKLNPSRVKIVVELDNQIDDPVYYAFCLKVDEYAQLALVNSSDYLRYHVNSTVRLIVGDETSNYRYHQNMDGSAHVAYYTAIIKLKGGLFDYSSASNSSGRHIVFENNCQENGNCVLDSSYPCVRDMDCGFANETMQSGKIGSSMDVKIFVAWEGTALNSIPLRSTSLLPSRFRAFSFTKYLRQMVNVFIPPKED